MKVHFIGFLFLVFYPLSSYASNGTPSSQVVYGTRCDLQLITGHSTFSDSAYGSAIETLEGLGYTIKSSEDGSPAWGMTEFGLFIYSQKMGTLFWNVQAFMERMLNQKGEHIQERVPFTNGERSLEGDGPQNRLFGMAIELVPSCKVLK